MICCFELQNRKISTKIGGVSMQFGIFFKKQPGLGCAKNPKFLIFDPTKHFPGNWVMIENILIGIEAVCLHL